MGNFSSSSGIPGKAKYTPEFWKKYLVPYNHKIWSADSSASITYKENTGKEYILSMECDCENEAFSVELYIEKKVKRTDEFGSFTVTQSSNFYAVIDENQMNKFIVLDNLAVHPVGSFASSEKCFEIVECFLNKPTQKPECVEWVSYEDVNIPEELYM